MTSFFLRRPIFTIVCSLAILISGLVLVFTLPVSEYPDINPPTVTVTAAYPGASAQAVEAAVTTPLEQALNDVNGLRYISSNSTQGASTITCTFRLGTNLDVAATDVQNTVQTVLPRLPDQTKQIGVTVAKNGGAFVMAIAFVSKNPYIDQLALSNYVELNVANQVQRVPGVSAVRIFGQRRYAMRIWLNPRALAARGLDASDVIAALQDQNASIAAGTIGAPPEPPGQPYTVNVRAEGRLTTPAQFAQIILRRNPDGGFTRLGDVATIALGAEDYSTVLRFDGHTRTVGLGVQQLPTANALSVASSVRAELAHLEKTFPPGITYKVAFDSTTFVRASITEVVVTLLLSLALVVLVIFLFLQDLGTTFIPAATIPISLIGSFIALRLFGFSINTITLFGLTLATGLVVDDAIVVLENIARFRAEFGRTGLDGTEAAIREIRSAVLASSLVLLAVFIPVAFVPGLTGTLYQQFAITIASSITISLFCSLTLTPVLSMLWVSHEHHVRFRPLNWFSARLHAFRERYRRALPRVLRRRRLVTGIFLAAMLLTALLFKIVPTGFVPDEDRGYFIVLIQAPQGASLDYETSVANRVESILRQQPEVRDIFDVGGFSFAGAGSNVGIMFVQLQPWNRRSGAAHSLNAVLQRVNARFFALAPLAQVFAFNPPALGNAATGGFQFELEDTGGVGLSRLDALARRIIAAARRDPNLFLVQTNFSANAPQLVLKLRRNEAQELGIPLSRVAAVLSADIGAYYADDFTMNGHSYRVYVQAQTPFRSRYDALQAISVRSGGGGMVPISALVGAERTVAPPSITHYDLFRAIEIDGRAFFGKSSGQAIAEMERLARSYAIPGVGYQWTGTALDEIESGNGSLRIFLLALVFIFLVLAAQYESWIDPLIVMLAVPLALFGALFFLALNTFALHHFLAQDIYAQVGYVMLIGLASKNAILIVQFANQRLERGADVVTAAIRAATIRLRPILMTSFTFIIALLPLVFATGPGSASRQSLGTTVFGGMLVSTLLNLLITPVFYVIVKGLELRFRRVRPPADGSPTAAATREGETGEPAGRVGERL
jgi:HAE1 family hydrophobic/amphiphilic exporter-1